MVRCQAVDPPFHLQEEIKRLVLIVSSSDKVSKKLNSYNESLAILTFFVSIIGRMKRNEKIPEEDWRVD